ncbi:MAG: lysophospholipid acyltransferase family protein [Gammaproteobacteria bacterium]
MRAQIVKLLLKIFAALPLWAAHACGAALGMLLAVLPNSLRRVAAINLAICFPELDAPARRRLLRRNLIETGKTFTEMGAMWHWPMPRLLSTMRAVSGMDSVDAAQRRGRGVILASPHLGAWEMAGLYVSVRFPMTSLYRPPRLRALEQLSRTARARFGARLVPTDASGVRALYQALGRGEVVGILPDQNPEPGSGVFAPFFGIPAYTMVLIARLARKTGAALFVTYAERLPHGQGYHLRFREAPAEFAAAMPEQAVAIMNQLIETCVREQPAQYQWNYKRFRIQPEGRSPLY